MSDKVIMVPDRTTLQLFSRYSGRYIGDEYGEELYDLYDLYEMIKAKLASEFVMEKRNDA